MSLLISGINMELFTEIQKKRLYAYFVVFIIFIGIALRFYAVDLRVLFTDEAVHYSFIRTLNTTQPYEFKDIVRFNDLKTLNNALNIYHNFEKSLNNNDSIWEISPQGYKNYVHKSDLITNVSVLFQPYFYFKHLKDNKGYRYDPVYHGPFLYYLGDVVFNLAGQHSIFLLRLPVVIVSVLSIFFVFLYARQLEKFGLILALLLVAISPALVYYSDLANYENYIAVFNMLGVGLLLIGIHRRSPWVLFLSGVTLLSMMTIKETALVAWFCIVMSAALTYLVLFIKNRPSELLRKFEDFLVKLYQGTYNKNILRYLFPAVLTFISGGILFVALYSSFGGHPDGVHDGLTSWMYWKNTGASSGHVKPFGYYSEIILQYDFMIAFLFFLAAVVILFTQRDRYKIFLVFWAFLLWLIYSIIPYKTPWLIINFLLPFAIVAGTGWNIIFKTLSSKYYKYLMVFIILVMSLNALTIAIKAKFFTYDNPENKLTYVHTYRDFESEVTAIYTLAQASQDGYNINISVAAPEYWPLPSYLYRFKNVGYFNGVKGRNLNLNAPILINDTRDNPELREFMLESDVNDFFKLRDFKQRPGVDHTLYVKEDLLKRYLDYKYYELWLYDRSKPLLKEATRNDIF